MLRDLLALDDHDLNGATAMAVASVVPAMTALVEAVAARLGIPTPRRDAPGTVPIAIRVDRPDLVGGDRLVNALAAARLYGSPAIVVRPRDGDDARLRRPGRRVRRRRDRPRARARPRGARRADGRAAAGRPADARPGDRARHRERHPGGTVFGHQALVAGLLARDPARARRDGRGRPRRRPRRSSPAACPPTPWARAIEGVDAIDPDLTLKGLAILSRRGRAAASRLPAAAGDPAMSGRLEAG